MSLRDKIINLLELRIGLDTNIQIADQLVELIGEHLNGVQLGLFKDGKG